ncbi:hypothetical protein DFJ58DRAFT_842646 [Suillus subalutaceus]|uniref:uncharacterized protein n=1 Tax=Suillus subalutaceus TaxID=48586 RepID=UPI001B86D211|nr:uncharacterized protein DFJ58DRAFT_842646 [Suillus subalutaceus]KAG1849433.1 hypothetical protein DFJ58DRAFT_842646 [Suillus subalutaceus]
MPLVTHSGRQTKAPSSACYVCTYALKDHGATESDVGDNQASKCTTRKQTRSRAAPKSARDAQTEDHPHPRPKARPLARKKSSDVNEAPEVQLADGGALMQTEFSADGSTNGADDKQSSAGPREDGTVFGNTVTNGREQTAVLSDGECDGAAVPSDGECDGAAVTTKQEKTGVASTAVRPHRSGAYKSYAPNHESEPAESSDSDSDWAAAEEKMSANDKQRGPAAAADHIDDAEGRDEEDMSEDEDGTTHKAGRLSKEGVLKAEEFGKRVMAEATAIGKEFGKHQRLILIEAGLATKATRKESPWNLHQAWFPTILPPSKESNLASWKVKQNAHYHAHPYKDPNHTPLWKKIRHHWDSVVASPEDLSSRKSSSLMTAVCEAFAKSPGDEESGRQASGFFAGSNMVKALIDARQLDVKCLIDEFTTILKYKGLEAAQAEGKGLSFLPPPAAVPNAPLLHNGKSTRDRNRMVAPIIISEAFDCRWMRMLDILYSTQLCIHDWPTGVPPSGPDFDLKSLSASQLRALVGPYLRKHLSNTYETELGRDEDEDDAEKAMTTKRKGVDSLCIFSRAIRLARYAGEIYSIPLVIDTDGIILHHLKDSEKFIKELPPHVARKHLTKRIREESPNSDESLNSDAGPSGSHQEALHLHPAAPRYNYQAPCSNSGAPHSQHGALRSNPPVSMHTDHDELLDYSVHPDDDLPPSSPPLPSPYAAHQGLNATTG